MRTDAVGGVGDRGVQLHADYKPVVSVTATPWSGSTVASSMHIRNIATAFEEGPRRPRSTIPRVHGHAKGELPRRRRAVHVHLSVARSSDGGGDGYDRRRQNRHSARVRTMCTKRSWDMRGRRRSVEDILCEVAWISRRGCGAHGPICLRTAPAILSCPAPFGVSFWRRCKTRLRTIHVFVDVRAAPMRRPRHPGRTPRMPLHWSYVPTLTSTWWTGASPPSGVGLATGPCACTRTRATSCPQADDGSTNSYDFDTLLFYVGMVTLDHFYRYDGFPFYAWCDG